METLINPTGTKKITVDDHKSITIFIQDFDPGSREFTLEVKLRGEKAECHIHGRAQSGENDEKIWHIRQTFQGETQVGRIDIRGTAENQGFFRCDAQGVLTQKSVDADAKISERVILFDQGRSKLLPVLTVKTDKVKSASHGATIAPVEPEKILYLQSRGINKKDATELIKDGFLK